MTEDSLQNIVDALSRRIARPAIIDDAQLRLLAHSAQDDGIDDVRRYAILHREAPPAAKEHVLAHGLARAEAPVEIPAKPEIGLTPRLAVPLRVHGLLLGYLLVDSATPLDDSEVAEAVSAAEAAAGVIHRERLMAELERSRERELIRDLLGDDESARLGAGEALAESDLFVATSPVVVLVVQPVLGEDDALGEQLRVAIDSALAQARRGLPPRHAIHLARPDHGVLLAAVSDRLRPLMGLEYAAEELRTSLVRLLPDGARAVVGAGAPQRGLEHALISYRQARQAARVGTTITSFGELISWGRLGIYRMLSSLPIDQITHEALPEHLTRLFASRDGQMLVETLETYLDRAGDAKATAETLCVHRGTLYHRLKKIEDITGGEMSDGQHRLTLHLGLTLARLGGLWPPRGP